MQIRIEPVKSNEIQILSDISANCFYDTFYRYNTKENMDLFLAQSFNKDVLEQEAKQQYNYFFFSKSGNDILGYMKLSDAETPPELKEFNAIEIARIYVTTEKMGTGVGKSMMDFAISFAGKLTKKIIWLGVWEHNKRAINFYNNYDFKKFGEHIFMVGNDPQTDWLLKRNIMPQY